MGVPLLDFEDFRAGGGRRDTLVRALGHALETYGFVNFTGHGVDPSLLDRAYRVAQAVFELPTEVKQKYETPHDGRQRGYTSFGIEHAKDQQVPDLKEFWHIGRTDATDGSLPDNRFPSEVPDFRPTALALFDALDTFSRDLLGAVALYLNLPPRYFVERVVRGSSLLRVIHYPALNGLDVPEKAVRAAAHEDVNLLTVLPASTAPGLELLDRDGNWLSVEPPAGAMICDTGDMMAHITQGRLPATTHRVVNPSGGYATSSRYSMPFFLHPRPEVRLDSIDGQTPGPTAGEFLANRLAEIGLTPGADAAD